MQSKYGITKKDSVSTIFVKNVEILFHSSSSTCVCVCVYIYVYITSMLSVVLISLSNIHHTVICAEIS